MTDWERVYACLAELEGEYGDLLHGQDGKQPLQEIMLMGKMAKLYGLLAALEDRGMT